MNLWLRVIRHIMIFRLYMYMRMPYRTIPHKHINMHSRYSPMTVLNVPLQSHFLYNGKCNSKVDAKLIGTILSYKAEMEWKGVEFPTFFLIAAAREIHDMCGLVFNLPELVTRVRVLMMRYHTFKEVIDSIEGHILWTMLIWFG